LARTDDGGNTDWYLPDRLGTIRDIVDDTGASLYHAAYDSFGQITSETGTGGDRFGFTGREHDAETGLYHYRARMYDPETGRFTEQDPIGFDAGDANLYRYVGNGPANAVDPSGLFQGPIPHPGPNGELPAYLDIGKPKPIKTGPGDNKQETPIDDILEGITTPPRKDKILEDIPIIDLPEAPPDLDYRKVLSGHYYIGTPPEGYVGPAGCGPCVGLVIIPKDRKTQPIQSYHFGFPDSPERTIGGIPIPQDSSAILVGAEQDVDTTVDNQGLHALQDVVQALKAHGIDDIQYVPAGGVLVSPDGPPYYSVQPKETYNPGHIPDYRDPPIPPPELPPGYPYFTGWPIGI